jgi:hypothetical protein
MLSKEDNIMWLQRHTSRYCSERDKMAKVVEDFNDVRKLGQSFTSVNKLEEVNLSEVKEK